MYFPSNTNINDTYVSSRSFEIHHVRRLCGALYFYSRLIDHDHEQVY